MPAILVFTLFSSLSDLHTPSTPVLTYSIHPFHIQSALDLFRTASFLHTHSSPLILVVSLVHPTYTLLHSFTCLLSVPPRVSLKHPNSTGLVCDLCSLTHVQVSLLHVTVGTTDPLYDALNISVLGHKSFVTLNFIQSPCQLPSLCHPFCHLGPALLYIERLQFSTVCLHFMYAQGPPKALSVPSAIFFF